MSMVLDLYFNPFLFSNLGEKFLFLVERRGQICLVNVLLFRNYSLDWRTMIHWNVVWQYSINSNIYVVTSEISILISINGWSPIQRKIFKLLSKFYEARISKCNILNPVFVSWPERLHEKGDLTRVTFDTLQ